MKSRVARDFWGLLDMPGAGEIRSAIARSGAARPPRPRRAFSLLDVLVTISVIAVLIAMLLPALGSVRETTHRVICSSNVRQIGLGIAMYAEDNQDMLPPSKYVRNPHVQRPDQMIWLREADDINPDIAVWDGLGHLFAGDYLRTPRVFYCPSHAGTHPFADYEDAWASEIDRIAGNYQYRGKGPGKFGSRHLHSIIPQTAALVSDGLRTQADFNHRVGTNILRADLSVFFFWDPNGELLNSLPGMEGEVNPEPIAKAWEIIDRGG